MKFLIDEDVPVKLLKFLNTNGFDCTRVSPGSSDKDNARQSQSEGRVFITLDKDFINASIYPPAVFNIIQIRIHPPLADSIIAAFEKLLKSSPSGGFKNLIILQEGGHLKISA